MDGNRTVMERKTSSGELYLVSCGHEECSASQSYGPVVRNYYMLHFVLEGEGHYFVNKEHYLVKKNQCFLTEPGVTTLYKAEGKNPWTYIWVCFNGTLAAQLLRQCRMDSENPVMEVTCVKEIKGIILDIMKCHALTPANECYIHSGLYMLFGKLEEDFSSTYNNTELNDNFYITKAIEYIEKNTFNDLCVNDVAKYLNISRSYLYSLFRQQLHTSPQQFLTNAKIGNARELLVSTDIPVSGVALSSGYKNAFAFSRAFKQVTGMSPSQYRKKRGKANELLDN